MNIEQKVIEIKFHKINCQDNYNIKVIKLLIIQIYLRLEIEISTYKISQLIQ